MFQPEGAECGPIYVQARCKKPADGTKWTVTVPDKPKATNVSIPPPNVKDLILPASLFATHEISTDVDGNDWAVATIDDTAVSVPGVWTFNLDNLKYQTLCTSLALSANMKDKINLAVAFTYKSLPTGVTTISSDTAFCGAFALLGGCTAWNTHQSTFSVQFESIAFAMGWDTIDSKVKYVYAEGAGRDEPQQKAFQTSWDSAFSLA